MTSQRNRLSAGGLIDRSTSLLFQFDGASITPVIAFKQLGSQYRNISKLYCEKSNGAIWVGTSQGIVRIFQSKASVILSVPEVPQGFKYTFCESKNGKVWIGASDGLYTYSTGVLDKIPQFSNLPVAGLCSDSEGNIWVSASDNVIKFSGGNVGSALLIGRFTDDIVP